MADSTGTAKVLRDITQAYLDGLAKISSTIADLGKRRIPDGERRVEQWIGVARAAKDGYVAAIDEGFAIWEKRIRQMMAPKMAAAEKEAASASKSASNTVEGWIDEWHKANESFMKSIRESGLGEEAVKQTKELRKTFEDGLKNLQKLWQPSSKSDK
jgi:hypothetical protein